MSWASITASQAADKAGEALRYFASSHPVLAGETFRPSQLSTGRYAKFHWQLQWQLLLALPRLITHVDSRENSPMGSMYYIYNKCIILRAL